MLYSSLPQLRCRAAAPSSEGALGGHRPTTYVLANDAIMEYRVLIENRLNAAA